MKKKAFLLFLIATFVMTSCSKNNHVSQSFTWEDKSWSIIEGKDCIVLQDEWLHLGDAGNYSIKLEHKFTDLDDGLYYLTIDSKNEGNQDYCYIYARNSENEEVKTSIPRYLNNESKTVTVRGIEVKNHTLNIGIASKGSSTNALLKDVQLKREENQNKKYHSLLGGSISWLDWEEDMGAKYYDEDGNEKDALIIMKEHGCNFVRLELYNNPGAYKDQDGNYFPSEYKNADSIFKLAQRANALNMEIQLSFMYSDYWGNDVIPADWEEGLKNYGTFSQKVEYLNDKVYEWTYSFMNRLKSSNIYPKYVSIGNEIDPGILIPYGDFYASEESKKAFCSFLNSGYKAVKDVSPSSQVVHHLGCNANDMHWSNHNGSGKYFFQTMKDNNVNYDVIGTSFYPYWAQTDSEYAIKKKLDLNDFKQWCEMMIDDFDKDILIMETGINWGKPGQLANNGAYENIFPYTPEGQRDYVLDMINTVKSVKDGRCVGSLYWDPILVRQEGIGWALYGNGQARDNCVETTTFFDYNHRVLPVLNAYKYN